jgi:polyphosphate kinase 2 (PPK2 family)
MGNKIIAHFSPFSAFIGNRCARYWSRDFTDLVAEYLALPLSGVLIQPYHDTRNRPVIVALGFMRALLPFAMSFQGARFGRQLTYNTYRNANYRWRPTMNIMHFHEKSGNYQPIALDPQLLVLARAVAEAIGHGKDPEETRTKLASIGFHVFGSGCGGYSVYRKIEGGCKILLNCTPYGPSILDETPRFILLERRNHFYSDHLRDQSDATVLDAATPREAKIRGYTYSGAFFSHQEWAALTRRYDEELKDYANACRVHGTRALPKHKRSPLLTKQPAPPEDLASLKAFIRTGRQTFQQWVDDRRWREVESEVRKMAKLIARYQKAGKAPQRVILYLEGLDCAGKSSTGMLICNALQRCGYDVNIAQHNRPPTPEQRAKPWMDRSRFQYPEDMYESGSEHPDHAALVWDRGPVGDFVYGNLDKLNLDQKMQRFKEFRAYDYNCRNSDVLFFKCFFVTDRDKIAATLGKRLAHKKIAQELKVWLDANSVPHAREGLDEILLHIDPTDFVAFNKYEQNIHKFSTVVRNTDIVGHVGGQANGLIHYRNPWLVINTSNRHAARLSMMAHFRGKLHEYAVPLGEEPTRPLLSELCEGDHQAKFEERYDSKFVPDDIADVAERGVSTQVIVQSVILGILLLLYFHQTWHVEWDDIT